jgi:hypothetical protein
LVFSLVGTLDGVAAEDDIVWVHKVNNIEGYDLLSHGGILTEGYIDVNLAQSFDPLVAEAVQRVLCLLQILLLEAHASEALPGQNVR